LLIPEVSEDGQINWKIWTLSTWLKGFDMHPEDEGLLRAASKPINEEEHLRTDVLIIGGGNA
jgi:hypothetical protein